MPKNPLDAILAEVLGDDGGLLLAGVWPEQEAPANDEPDSESTPQPSALLPR